MIFLKKYYKYLLLLIPLVILYRPFLFFGNQYLKESAGNIFLSNLYGGSYGKEKIEIVVSVVGFFGILLLNLLFGDYISKDFYTNSEYIFVRVKKKSKWYHKKCFQLFLYCCLGTMIYIAMYMGGAISKAAFPVTISDITVMLNSYIMLTLFAYFTTLFINILSILYGTSIGFIATYSFVILSEMLTFLLQNMKENIGVKIIHLLNPMSNLTVSWNFSTKYVIWGIAYFIAINIVLTIIGKYIVHRQEIGLQPPDK